MFDFKLLNNIYLNVAVQSELDISSTFSFSIKSAHNDCIRTFIEAKGVVTCHEKDKFDKKIGRKIAYSKAFLEGYRKFHHIIDASIEALVNKHIDLSHTRDNLEAIINDEKSYLDKLRNCEK